MLILTCEHAVNTLPATYKTRFSEAGGLMNSHRGIDFGALELATHLANFFGVDLYSATVSRMLIDCNRSLHHPRCFSEISLQFPAKMKQEIIENYYHPFRQPVLDRIEREIKAKNRVLHLSIHSFTPALNGEIRNNDLGLLYDSRRKEEAKFAKSLPLAFKNQVASTLKCRLNYPYQGKADGFTTAIRKLYPEKHYLGIEIEVNQNIAQDKAGLDNVKQALTASLKTVF